MEYNYRLLNFKVREREYIIRQLKAFCLNYCEGITIEKRVGYYKSDITYKIYVGSHCDCNIQDYVYMVDSLDELKGWLYGMVQANNGGIKLFKGEL